MSPTVVSSSERAMELLMLAGRKSKRVEVSIVGYCEMEAREIESPKSFCITWDNSAYSLVERLNRVSNRAVRILAIRSRLDEKRSHSESARRAKFIPYGDSLASDVS